MTPPVVGLNPLRVWLPVSLETSFMLWGELPLQTHLKFGKSRVDMGSQNRGDSKMAPGVPLVSNNSYVGSLQNARAPPNLESKSRVLQSGLGFPFGFPAGLKARPCKAFPFVFPFGFPCGFPVKTENPGGKTCKTHGSV